MELTEPRWSRLLPDQPATSRACHKAWAAILPHLEQVKQVRAVDATLVADYCLCVVRVRELEGLIGREGFVVAGQRCAVKHPASTILNQYRIALRKAEEALLLSPLSRSRLSKDATATFNPARPWESYEKREA